MASDYNGNYIEGTDATDFTYYPDGAPAYTSTSTTANTGGGLTNWVNSLGTIGTGVLSTLLGNQTAQQQARAQQTQAQSNAFMSANTTKMMLIGGAVLAVLVVAVMIFRRK